MISVIIPTRWSGDFSKLLRLLESLEKQTLQADEILIVIDFDVARKPLTDAIQTAECDTQNCKVVSQDGYGICAARNCWIKRAKGEYILLCDDDVRLQEEDVLERMMDEYNEEARYKIQDTRGIILYPTITFHDTGNIQTQGFTWYNWLMCWPVPKYGVERKSKLRSWFPKWLVNIFGGRWDDNQTLQLIWSICVFGRKSVFEGNLYDERFWFIYEDLEWSYRAYKSWIHIHNSEDIQIQHWEKQKDLLARSYIDKPENVYLKTKHRIWFVLKHANTKQLLMFYLVGFWVSNGRTLLFILLYGGKKGKLVQERWRGIKEGVAYSA
jgi:glycosyltransferase involved in cell wall biosynthesis